MSHYCLALLNIRPDINVLVDVKNSYLPSSRTITSHIIMSVIMSRTITSHIIMSVIVSRTITSHIII